MPTREDLHELHALAESIADDVVDYRSRRRQRTDELIRARIEAQATEPVKRRRRHRGLAALVVAVLALVATVAVVALARGTGSRSAAPRPAAVTGPADGPAAAGRQAAREIESSGRSNDVFACLAKSVQALQGLPTANSAAARRAFLQACLHS